MEAKRWPRKNDPDSIRQRQEALGLDGGVTGIDLAPFASDTNQLLKVLDEQQPAEPAIRPRLISTARWRFRLPLARCPCSKRSPS